ncbi:manganese efflux pump MntP family protein [Haloimpatiens massiliensis]|uniref:manganese efflux pump MntP n=1 Tax=Haloimpatiens massiliensis TaxID=1658110 RepID=UPI000C816091|nr:manganese efflux pump [Haloimpatiens massiliensis]
MSFYELTLIALALSLDAFGVAISLGICNLKFRKSIPYIASFGFFQFFFAFVGAYAGILFNSYIAEMPKVIGGIIIVLVGILMLKEGFQHEENKFIDSTKAYFILGMSVSIDAMVIGFTVLNSIKSNWIILSDSLYIGFITAIMTTIAFSMCRYLKKIKTVSAYADYIGGVILIMFGLKMVFF